MKVYYNNRIGISTNQFPTSQHMNSNDVANNWMELVVDGENKVNFIDDEHIQLSILPLPRFYAFTVFKIVWTNKSAANPTTTRYYQIEKVHKIASNRIILNLKIEPYLSYIYYTGVRNGDATNADVGGMFNKTIYTLIRSPHLPISSFNYRDPLMEEIIKGCNRVPVREKQGDRVNDTQRWIKINYMSEATTAPNYTAVNNNFNWRWWLGKRPWDGNPKFAYTRLGFYVDEDIPNSEKYITSSSKYAVFVIPASDWMDMHKHGGAFAPYKDTSYNSVYTDSNSGIISIAHALLPLNGKYKYVFTMSSIQALRYRNNVTNVKLSYLPLSIKGEVRLPDASNASVSLYDANEDGKYGFNVLFPNEDVVVKIPIFDYPVNLCCGSSKAYFSSGITNTINNQFATPPTQTHNEHRVDNTVSKLQEYIMQPYSEGLYQGSKNLNSYFKGIYYGQAVEKNQNPIVIGYPQRLTGIGSGSGDDRTNAARFLAFVSKYNAGEEWEIDLKDFQTIEATPKTITARLDNKIYNWGHFNISNATYVEPNSWMVNHIYLKQYLDFSIGTEPINLSMVFANIHSLGDGRNMEGDGIFVDNQSFKMKTYFVNGFVHSWYVPTLSYCTKPTANVYSSRSGYMSMSAISEYQQWLTANANVLESGKTNATTSLLAGIGTGLINMGVGAMNATWAPDLGSGFTGGSPNFASGLNTLLTSTVNYSNTIRSINAQKLDAKNASGSRILGATTDFIPFEMLSALGVVSNRYTLLTIGGTYRKLEVEFVQTAMVNDLSTLIYTMKQTLYYNGYYGVVNATISPTTEFSFGKHPRYYELADNNAITKAMQCMMGFTHPGVDTGNDPFDYNAYDGQRWVMWYIDKLTQGVMFYNHTLDDEGMDGETEPAPPPTKSADFEVDKHIDSDIEPKGVKINVSKKKTKKN